MTARNVISVLSATFILECLRSAVFSSMRIMRSYLPASELGLGYTARALLRFAVLPVALYSTQVDFFRGDIFGSELFIICPNRPLLLLIYMGKMLHAAQREIMF